MLFQSIFDMIISNVQRLLDALPLFTQGYDSLVSVDEILSAKDVEQNGSASPSPGPSCAIPGSSSWTRPPDQP